MRIYLVGFMGCGKSSVGERLAHKMNCQLIDLDTKIEEDNGLTIPEIFEQQGEEAFRVLEQKALHETFLLENAIIATGGGAPCFFDNMSQINQHGYSFYLKKSEDFLVDKLMNAKNVRPLVQGKTEQQLRDYINETLTARNPHYYQASFTLETSHIRKKHTAVLINAMVKTLQEKIPD